MSERIEGAPRKALENTCPVELHLALTPSLPLSIRLLLCQRSF
jgi:hypothetical protein